jgi:hypothetical protein
MTIKKPRPAAPFPGMGGTLIGAPKLKDFQPLTGDEFHQQLKVPLQQALSSGVDVNQVLNLPCFVLARVIATIDQATAEASMFLSMLVDFDSRGLLDDEHSQKMLEPLADVLNAAKEAREKFDQLVQETTEKTEPAEV